MANDSNFVIQTKVVADTSKVQEQLNKSSKSLKMNARLTLDMSQFETQLKKINTKDADVFKLVKQTFKDVEYEGKKAVAVVQQFSDGIGNTKERIVYLEQIGTQFKLLGSELSKMTQKIEPFKASLTSVTTETSKVFGYVNEGGKNLNATITTTVQSMENTDGTIKKLRTTTTEYKNEQGQLVKLTQQFDEKNKQVGTTLKEVSKDETKIIKSNRSLGQSFSDVVQKVAKFYLASLPIRLVQKAITDTVQTVKDFDKAFTEMAKVADSSGEALDNYTKKLGDLGTEVGRTRTTMTELATGFLKAGYDEEDSAQLARYGALLQNTADEQLEASEATSILVSALKAFNLQANDSMRVLDDINIVSADFAVSSSDISRGLTQAGASMATYGNSLEQTISLLAAGENFLPVTD